MSIQRITIFAPPEPDNVIKATEIIGAAAVNGVTMTIDRMHEGNVIRFLVDYPDKALQALEAADFLAKSEAIEAIEIPDKPGSMASFLRFLKENLIEYDFLEVFPSGQDNNKAVVVFKTKFVERLARVVDGSDYRAITPNDLT